MAGSGHRQATVCGMPKSAEDKGKVFSLEHRGDPAARAIRALAEDLVHLEARAAPQPETGRALGGSAGGLHRDGGTPVASMP
jgi:hypothetical protein